MIAALFFTLVSARTVTEFVTSCPPEGPATTLGFNNNTVPAVANSTVPAVANSTVPATGVPSSAVETSVPASSTPAASTPAETTHSASTPAANGAVIYAVPALAAAAAAILI